MVLFDIGSAAWKLDEWKREIWDYARIGVPWHDRESNDAVIFGFLCGWFLAEVDNWEGSMGGRGRKNICSCIHSVLIPYNNAIQVIPRYLEQSLICIPMGKYLGYHLEESK